MTRKMLSFDNLLQSFFSLALNCDSHYPFLVLIRDSHYPHFRYSIVVVSQDLTSMLLFLFLNFETQFVCNHKSRLESKIKKLETTTGAAGSAYASGWCLERPSINKPSSPQTSWGPTNLRWRVLEGESHIITLKKETKQIHFLICIKTAFDPTSLSKAVCRIEFY